MWASLPAGGEAGPCCCSRLRWPGGSGPAAAPRPSRRLDLALTPPGDTGFESFPQETGVHLCHSAAVVLLCRSLALISDSGSFRKVDVISQWPVTPRSFPSSWTKCHCFPCSSWGIPDEMWVKHGKVSFFRKLYARTALLCPDHSPDCSTGFFLRRFSSPSWIFVDEVTAGHALWLESASWLSGACAAHTGTVAICVSIRELKINGNGS